MAQASAITINDGQATPVATTFNPERVTPELSLFADRATGVSAKFRRLSVRFKPASQRTKAELDISIPVWGVLTSGAEGVLRTLRAKVLLDLPDGCTDAERKDLYAFAYNGLNHTLIKGAMRDLDPLY